MPKRTEGLLDAVCFHRQYYAITLLDVVDRVSIADGSISSMAKPS
jgi:hypothetical protein